MITEVFVKMFLINYIDRMIVFALLCFLFFLSPGGVNALEGRLGAVQGSDSFESFTQNLLNLAVPLGVFVALVLLSYSAFVMITSAGNPEKLKDAREIATNAVIGAVVIALSVVILVVLDRALGLGIGS